MVAGEAEATMARAIGEDESVVISEQIDPTYEPTPDEIREYSEWLGMDENCHRHLMWIAREALKAPLPEHWKLCQSPKGELYYFNFKTGASSWDHPSDPAFLALFSRYKDTSPKPECDGESAAIEVELGQLLRRARKLGLCTAESMEHVLDNVSANTVTASEYVRWWRPRVEDAEQQQVSDKLAEHFEVLQQNLLEERRQGFWPTSSPAAAALESAIAQLTPRERDMMQGKQYGEVQACKPSQSQQIGLGAERPPTSPAVAESCSTAALKGTNAATSGDHGWLKDVFMSLNQVSTSLFGFGRSQQTLLPV